MKDRILLAKSLVPTEPDEALRICNDVMNEDVDGEYGRMALFMTGYIMLEAERFGLAYHIYERCAQLNPEISEIYSNMGMCLEDADPYKAIRMFQKAYQMDEGNAKAYANEGLIHLLTGRPDKCISLCDKALSIDPELVSATHNKGLAQIMTRDWADGWKNYYDTLGVKHREKRDYGLPDWNGEEGTVIVYGEQGVGDEIMFASCLADLQKTNKIILDCDSRLESLFNRSFDCPVYGTRFHKETPLVDEHSADYQCAIGQLPHFYRNSEDSFPGDPYLIPNPDRCIQWRALFDTFKGKKVGIAWRGGLQRTGEKKRSLELDDLSPIFNDRDTFISLEYKDVDQSDLDKYGLKSYKETKAGGDIDDLASIISELDYVVTCCTTVVYIAGALGVPCFVLVPDMPGYRYHIEGQFPWYDSVSLVRKKGSWADTAKAVKTLIDSKELKCCA